MTRTLFIVSRRHADLYQYLKERFAEDEHVEVILDRRGAGEVKRPESPDIEARGPERRLRPEVDTELATRSHAVVTIG